MKDSKAVLEAVAEEERRNKAEAAEIARKRLEIYQGLAVGVIRKMYKFRDDLKKSFGTFQEVNSALAELELLYPGYLSFLSKFDAGNTEFEPAEVRYLIDYLLTGKWTKDADFWRVLSQIADTISQAGNIFKEVGNG